jgi:hypothetical protein
MYLRAALVVKHKYVKEPMRVVSVVILLAGLGVSTFREYLNFVYPSGADEVYGAARVKSGAALNTISSTAQVLFSILMFKETLKGISPTANMARRRRIANITIVIQSLIIFGCTIYYAVARPLGYKTASSILPLIAALSARFTLDFRKQD